MAQATLEHAGSMQIRHDPSVAQRVFKAVAQWLERRRTERELHRLNDRMLADIGLNRVDIEIVAAQAIGTTRTTDAPAANAPLWTRPIEWALLARARTRTAHELARLPDYMLADIGIERRQIQEVAEAVTAKSAARGEKHASSRAVSSPVHDLLHRVEAAARPLRQWQISRVATGHMARLNRPANRNETHRGVA